MGKKPLGQAMSSLDSARFKSTAESDGIKVEKDEQPIEPAISIFDLIENEKSKGDTAWRNALKSQPLLPVADLDSKMEHLNSRFEVLFKSLAKLRSEGNLKNYICKINNTVSIRRIFVNK